MKSWKSKLLALLLSGVLCLGAAACAPEDGGGGGGTVEEDRPGLYVEDGTLMRKGEAFRGFGVNYLGLFYDSLAGYEGLLDGLNVLAGYGVKCVRVPVNATYDENVLKLYFDNPDLWWGKLDAIVKRAEETGVGLICGFFWSETTIPAHFGEEVRESMRNPESKSSRYMEEYIKEFMERYGESEAVWGFEYGNEIMWAAQVPPSGWADQRKLYDCNDILALYTNFTAWIKQYDKYDRFIGSGDAGLRNYCYNSYQYNETYPDTRAEQEEMIKKLIPMDGVSWHDYNKGVACLEDPGAFLQERLYTGEDGEEVQFYGTWKEYFEYLTETARSAGKVAYLGETAFSHPDADRKITYEENRAGTEGIAKAAYETGFPLVMFWNYDPLTEEVAGKFDGVGTRWESSWNENWDRGRAILDVVKEYNQKIDRESAA